MERYRDAVGTFDDYRGQGFCEMADADRVARPHYERLRRRLDSLDAPDLDSRVRMIEGLFRRQGITFAVYGNEDGTERTWPLDLVPRIIPGQEWRHVEAGLTQRVKTLNAFLEDVYVGAEEVMNDGIIPRWLVESSDGYLPEAKGIEVPIGARCIISGIDIVRDDAGTYRVLEDNVRVPSGISYVLENRVALTRVLPVAFAKYRVKPVSHYGASLLRAQGAMNDPR
jgi:uncharacterized circularly permuted ATP-grasp superfamily protein